MNQKQKAAIAHYKRMQKWVRTRHKEGYPHGYLMFVAIDETWGVEDCIYCRVNNKNCEGCELRGEGYFEYEGCCNGLWNEMNDSQTWGEWLEASEKVVEYVKKYG